MDGLGKMAWLPGNIMGVPEVHNHKFKARLVRIVLSFSPPTCCPNANLGEHRTHLITRVQRKVNK